ncbi:MAG: hypothetical protein ACI8TX_003811 [Hyphomicrobiaceae bacterium]|jgi:hypothetical protein
MIHVLVVLAALFVLPVLPAQEWSLAGDQNPSLRIMAMLAATVGLPFLVLASTGPLIQAWFARRHPNRSPYRLYAVSNFGSMLALLAYTFVVDSTLSLSMTSSIWSVAFSVSVALVLTCGFVARLDTTVGGALGSAPKNAEEFPGEELTPSVIALWRACLSPHAFHGSRRGRDACDRGAAAVGGAVAG